MNREVLQVADLNFAYSSDSLQVPILRDIQMVLRDSEILVLSGPSGSGKTTLLTLIGALRSFRQGSIHVMGKELRGANEEQRRMIRCKIGYIFQSHNLLSFLSAEQNVLMSAQLEAGETADCARMRARAALEQVGLGDRLDFFPHQLSGGQKQRVAIARALVNKPKLILADEPTASLDSASGRQVIDLLKALAKEQCTAILLVTHDARILDVADRMLYMQDGGITNPRPTSSVEISAPAVACTQ